MVLGHALSLVAGGLLMGIALSLVTGRLLENFCFR